MNTPPQPPQRRKPNRSKSFGSGARLRECIQGSAAGSLRGFAREIDAQPATVSMWVREQNSIPKSIMDYAEREYAHWQALQEEMRHRHAAWREANPPPGPDQWYRRGQRKATAVIGRPVNVMAAMPPG